jgi:hypothetical protein
LISFDGYVDNFEIGPLRVRSASGKPGASAAFLLSPSECFVSIDGAVDLYGITLSIYFDLRRDGFTLRSDFSIGDHLFIHLEGYSVGALDLKNLGSLDFFVHFKFQSDIIAYLFNEFKKIISGVLHSAAKELFGARMSMDDMVRALTELPYEQRKDVVRKALELHREKIKDDVADTYLDIVRDGSSLSHLLSAFS